MLRDYIFNPHGHRRGRWHCHSEGWVFPEGGPASPFSGPLLSGTWGHWEPGLESKTPAKQGFAVWEANLSRGGPGDLPELPFSNPPARGPGLPF